MSFPGVPYELEYLLSIIDFSSYKDNSSGKMAQKVICFYDIGESYLQDILNSLESHLSRSFPNIEFSYRVSHKCCLYSIEYRYNTQKESLEFLSAFHDEFKGIKKEIGNNIIFDSEDSLESFFIKKLNKNKLTLSVCDSFLRGALKGFIEHDSLSSIVMQSSLNFHQEELLRVFQLPLERVPEKEELQAMLFKLQGMIQARALIFELGLRKKENYYVARLFITFDSLDLNFERLKLCFQEVKIFDFETQDTHMKIGIYLELPYKDFLPLDTIRNRLLLDTIIVLSLLIE